MTTPNSIVTPQTPKSSTFSLSTTANTNYTAPTNTVLGVTAGADGARLTRLAFIPTATCTATQIQIFRSSDGGTTKRFVRSVLMPATTVSGTTLAGQADVGFSDFNPMILSPNEQVYFAQGNGSIQINGEAEWCDF